MPFAAQGKKERRHDESCRYKGTLRLRVGRAGQAAQAGMPVPQTSAWRAVLTRGGRKRREISLFAARHVRRSEREQKASGCSARNDGGAMRTKKQVPRFATYGGKQECPARLPSASLPFEA